MDIHNFIAGVYRAAKQSRAALIIKKLAPVSSMAVLLSAFTGQPAVAAAPPASLPDPLLMQDGRRVSTVEMWTKERRPELRQLFQEQMYGNLPPKPAQFTATVEREDAEALGKRAVLREVVLRFGPEGTPPIYLLLVMPKGVTAAPVVLQINYFGNHTLLHDPKLRLNPNWMPERGQGVVQNRATEASRGTWAEIWHIEELIARGYALATFYNGDVDPDRPDERGLQRYLAQLGGDPANPPATIAAWAWGLMRAVDYLVAAPGVDAKRIVVTGHSRMGKAALLAGALDERIAVIIPHQAGCAGSAPSRAEIAIGQPFNTLDTATTKRPETVKLINEKFPHWFNAAFKTYNDAPERLPFDQHSLVALCAPRPVLFTNGRSDTWINPAGQFTVLQAAAPVYRLLGAGDFAATRLPKDGETVGTRLGFFLRAGGHSLTPEDWKAFLDFADQHLSPAPSSAGKKVARWEVLELEFKAAVPSANPFLTAELSAIFTAPSGKPTSVNGFYDGDGVWRLRFAPDEEGEWQWRVAAKGVTLAGQGVFQCTAGRSRGFIRIHPRNPYAFAYSDGTAFFPMGDTCYGLFDDTPITPALRTEYLKKRREQGFNFIRLGVSHSPTRGAREPDYWPWGGTPAKPDLDVLNPRFFAAYDGLVRQMLDFDMNLEMLVLNFYKPPMTNPALWTPARQELWLRYLLARYGAYRNIFLWTLANEYETHPDGKYRLDFPADVEWAKATARFIKANDPHRHLVTVHPVVSASRRGESPRSPIEPPWRIGEFYGAGNEFDVLSQQTGQMEEGARWDESLKCWTGDSKTLTASIAADRRYRKPVLNSENGYEYLRGDATSKQQVHHTDKVRRSSWRIVCAGGWFAAGFHGTLGHSDSWNRIDPSHRYDFILRDEGAGKQLGILQRFFTALPFDALHPFSGVAGNAVALADPGRLYVVYLPSGGSVNVDLAAMKSSATYHWFNPVTGQATAPQAVRENRFAAPENRDAVLVIRAGSTTEPK